MDRLRKDLKEISFNRCIIEQARCVHVAREKNDSRIGTDGANRFRQLNPIEVRHHHIGDNNVRTMQFRRLLLSKELVPRGRFHRENAEGNHLEAK